MKKLKSLAFAGAAALMLSSCASSVAPVTGFIYSDVTAPHMATSNNVGTKVGTASAKSILGWVGMGDASINAAAQNAGITKISHVDYHSTNILGIIATYEVMVYGE